MNVLFSPIGNTDPITGGLDGAMLHICRHSNIDKVIMYLSKDICAIHHKDNRYVTMVEKLARFQNRTIECEIIEKEDLEDVQVFDYFIEEFDGILSDIEQKYPDDKLFLNVSSGTPAMKSALQVLAYYRTRSYSIIQVTGPGYSVQRIEFDIDTAFENDNDNKPDFPRRIIESKNKNLRRKSEKKIICALIDKYDYSAALTAAKNIKITDKRFLKALEATDKRYKFFLDDAKKLYDEAGINVEFRSELEEYLLILGIKNEHEEYTDFIRAITPVVYELDKLILKSKCGLDIDEYIIKTDTLEKWNTEKLKKAKGYIVETAYETLSRKISDFDNPNRYKLVYSSNLNDIIQSLSVEERIKSMSRTIRDLEESMRNKATHSLNGAVDKKSFTDAKPLYKLYDAFVVADLIVPPDDTDENKYRQKFFNEYTNINKTLKELLENC